VAFLKRLLALVLLALALSPFNAPFHTAVVDNATTEQIVPVESLIALRESTDCRAMVQRRAVEPDGVSIAPLFDVPVKPCIVRCPGSLLRGAIARITSTGDPSLLATVLRV
jgi:hypothetical protein